MHLNLNMKALINMQSHLSKNHPVISPYVGTKLTCIVMEINIDTPQNACVYMHAYKIRALENSICFVCEIPSAPGPRGGWLRIAHRKWIAFHLGQRSQKSGTEGALKRTKTHITIFFFG